LVSILNTGHTCQSQNMNNELTQFSDCQWGITQITKLFVSPEDSHSVYGQNHQLTEKLHESEIDNEDDSFSEEELLKLLEFLNMEESEAEELFNGDRDLI